MKDSETEWYATTMKERKPSFGQRRDRHMTGDIEPVRRSTALVMGITLVAIAALIVVGRGMRILREPKEPAKSNVAESLDSRPGNIYVKSVVAGRFSEVFNRTAWIQERVSLLHDQLGQAAGDVATDEFFDELRAEFASEADAPAVLTADGIEDRPLFGRASGIEVVSVKDNVRWDELCPNEVLTEYRYKLSYPNADSAPRVETGNRRIKSMEVSLFVTAGGKIVKGAVTGNAVVHEDTIETY
ncbi:MAG: hypothetical protein J7M12_00355 [Candidatus Hydrogenedentes bacterium]|nr:hypothetical protein [Candidatus Hydrogenedentota bacterium]